MRCILILHRRDRITDTALAATSQRIWCTREPAVEVLFDLLPVVPVIRVHEASRSRWRGSRPRVPLETTAAKEV